MTKLILATVLVATTAGAGTVRVAGSKHDLTSMGPGAQRAVTEANPCIFCHVSHGGAEVLGNRPEHAGGRPYESSTMTSPTRSPTGVSRVCLSCHDGTVAPGHTRKREIAMTGGGGPIPPGPSNLGTDLRTTHPISIRPPPGRDSSAPRPGDAVKLDRNGEVQCTSCHDPHSEFGGDAAIGKFLVKPLAGSALCTSCHAGRWRSGVSSHATSSAFFTLPGEQRATTVAQAGCSACHVSHDGDPGGRLLRRGEPDDDADCLRCHSGAVARLDVAHEVSKPWGHRSRGRQHDAAEGTGIARGHSLPEVSPGARRHVACVDCHEPHSANRNRAAAPAASGLLGEAWGIDLRGQRVGQARFEYEVCLKCHGDSANKPQTAGISLNDRVRRAADDVNLRRVFDPSAASFHPVAAPGKNPIVPSLKPPLNPASMIYCSDCHASDDGAGAGGVGARGPHGSTFPYLLERQYLTADLTPEGPASYALCYKCHDRERLLADRADGHPLWSPFSHGKHVRDANAPCSACHDAHGISSTAGNDRENAHLVAFDLSIVKPGNSGPPRYESQGPGHGSCTLVCHGRVHVAASSSY